MCLAIPGKVLEEFDRRGMRMGLGAGFYDRTLEILRQTKPVFALGVAYAGQEVAETPCDEHDQPLDAIVTEREYRRFTRSA